MPLAFDPALFHFATDIRVRWPDTDAVGITYNGAFLTFFDVARVEFRRAVTAWRSGVSIDHPSVQDRLSEDRGVVFTLASTTIDWRAPSRVDNRLRIATRVGAVGKTSYTHEYIVTRLAGGVVVALGSTVQVRVDPVTLRPLPFDDEMRAELAGFQEALRTGAASFPPRVS